MQTVRYAVVGCGGIANAYHLPALVGLAGGEFVVACDLIEERAQKAVEQFGAGSYTLDYREIMAREDVDLVCIFTKVEAHCEIAIAAANAGKHVFTQKPFARNLREGHAMIAAAESNRVLLRTSFMHSYFDETVAAADWVRSGRIGKIELVRQRNATGNPRATVPSFGGAMNDIGSHGIDLIRTVLGQEITRVLAKVESDVAPPPWGYPAWQDPLDRPLSGGEANAFLMYELADGAIATHEIQWSAHDNTSRWQTQIYGTAGSVFIRVPGAGGDLAVAALADRTQERSKLQWQALQLPGNPMGRLHHQALLDAVRARHIENPGHDGMVALRVFHAARQSSETGSWIEV